MIRKTRSFVLDDTEMAVIMAQPGDSLSAKLRHLLSLNINGKINEQVNEPIIDTPQIIERNQLSLQPKELAKALVVLLKNSKKISPVKADLIAILEAELNPEVPQQLPGFPPPGEDEDEGIDDWVADKQARKNQNQVLESTINIEPTPSTLKRIKQIK